MNQVETDLPSGGDRTSQVTVTCGGAALRYAELGLRVVPLFGVDDGICECAKGAKCVKSAGKHPRIRDWPKEASSDPRQVVAWWDESPASNVGLAMGGPARLVALDVDGEAGRASLARLEAEHGPLPRTWTSRSGRADGGEHRLFRVPDELDISRIANKVEVLPGLDIRGERGQIVAPPSMHRSGTRYRWLVSPDECPAADLPAWLFRRLTEPKEPKPAPVRVERERPLDHTDEQKLKRASAYLAKCEPAISGQGGHAVTFKTAMMIGVGFALSQEDCFDLLWSEWNPRCDPPWSDRELRRKVTEAYSKGTMRFGALLEEERPLPAWTPPLRVVDTRAPAANDTSDTPRAAPRRSVVAVRPPPPAPDLEWNAIGAVLESIDAPDADPRAAVEKVIDLLPALTARRASEKTRREEAAAREHLNALRAAVNERCAAGRDATIEQDDAAHAAVRGHLDAASKALGLQGKPRRIDPTKRVRERIGAGPLLHIPTPIKTLNEFTRGGLIAGRLCVIGGAPDAGKTSLAVQIAHHAALHGYAVAFHAVDEDAEGVECRIGQACGLVLEDLERRDPEALRFLADRLEEVPNLVVVDEDEDAMTVEDTAEALVDLGRRHGSPGLVLVVDSLQTARVRGIENARTAKDRADMVTATLKSIARRTGALVIVTSELARGAYRARTTKDRTEPMASFKESGAIEYAMTIGLVLTNVKGEANVVHVSVPKNKRGERGAFLLRRNPRRCTYEDGGRVEDEDEDERQGSGAAPADAQIERDMERARHVLRSHPGISGIQAWVDRMGINANRARKVCRMLIDDGEVEDRRERGRPRLYLRPPPSEPSAATAEHDGGPDV